MLAGGQHQCAVLGHKWESNGGRICPRGDPMGGGPRSQNVYVCGSCGLEDYGQPGGPAHDECFKYGPCDHGCIAEKVAEPDVCPNCDTALPEGCGGVFRDDGAACRLNSPPPSDASDV